MDIIEAILSYIYERGRVKKTHILYATNLNTRSLEKYLNQLISIHAVECVEGKRGVLRYTLTPYGRQILKLLLKLRKILENPDPMQLDNELVLERLGDFVNGDRRSDSIKIQKLNVQGFSGLIYDVILLIVESEKYLLLPITRSYRDDADDFIMSLSHALTYLIDTEHKCLIVFKGLNEYDISFVQSVIRSLFNNAGISEERYLFVNI